MEGRLAEALLDRRAKLKRSVDSCCDYFSLTGNTEQRSILLIASYCKVDIQRIFYLSEFRIYVRDCGYKS